MVLNGCIDEINYFLKLSLDFITEWSSMVWNNELEITDKSGDNK